MKAYGKAKSIQILFQTPSQKKGSKYYIIILETHLEMQLIKKVLQLLISL